MKLSATARHIHYSRQSGVTPFQLIVGLLVLVGLGVGGYCLTLIFGGGDKGGKPREQKAVEVEFADDMKELTETLNKAITDKKIDDQLITRLDSISGTFADEDLLKDVPANAKAAIVKTALEYLPKLKEILTKIAAIPELSEKLKPIVDNITKGLTLYK